MTSRLWRGQLTLVWLVGFALLVFIFNVSSPITGGGINIYEIVYEPIDESMSVKGSPWQPMAWFLFLATAIAWLAPFFAAWLAWSGRRALKGQLDLGQRDRLRYGTVAAFVIVASYLTPVGWTLVYGLTRWSMVHIWGEGPLAHTL